MRNRGFWDTNSLGQSSASRRPPIAGLIRLLQSLQSVWSSALRCHFSFPEFICFRLTASQPSSSRSAPCDSLPLIIIRDAVRAVHFINVTFDGMN